jgi:hypothetical protein
VHCIHGNIHAYHERLVAATCGQLQIFLREWMISPVLLPLGHCHQATTATMQRRVSASVSCGAIGRCPGGAKSSKCTTPGTSCWHEAQNFIKLLFVTCLFCSSNRSVHYLIHQQHSITFKEKYRPYNSRSLHCEFVSLERNA